MTLILILTSASILTSTSEVKILKGHNLLIFKARTLIFCGNRPTHSLLKSDLDFDLSLYFDFNLRGKIFWKAITYSFLKLGQTF